MSKLLRSLPVLLTLFHSFSDPGMAQEGVTCDAEPTSMSIQYGDLIDCTLEIGTDRDIFRFAGILGDIVTLQIADFDSFAPTVAMIDVFDPTGSALISADGTIEFTLVKSGIHSVRVSELGNDATVPVRYSLGLDRLVPRSDFAARVCFGCSVGESLDPAGDLDLYYFTATEGDVVELAVFDPNLFEDAVAVADVFDPAGLPVANIDSAGEPGSITIQTSGDFAIRITELNRNDPMIPYELRLDCVGGPCVGQVDLCSAEATLVSDLVARGVGITRLGDTGAFSFSVGNLGGTVAQEVVATIALPQGLQLSNATPGRGSCSEVNPIRCELGALEPRESVTLSVSAEILLESGALEIPVQVVSSTCDPDPSNNISSLKLELDPAEEPEVEIVFPQVVDGRSTETTFQTSLLLVKSGGSGKITVDFFESPTGDPMVITLARIMQKI